MTLAPLAALFVYLLAAAAPRHRAPAHAQPLGDCARMRGRIVNDDGARTRYVVSDAAHCLEVDIVGTATFTDDDADVASLSPGGSLVATETRGGTTRTLSLAERGGRVERAYRVNGASRPAEESAEWFRGVVLDLVRDSGVGAEQRVARILRQRGAEGVLDEVAQLRSDYVRRVYLARLLDADLTSVETRRVAQVAGERIASDHDRSTVLNLVLDRRGADRGVADAVVRAASTIGSDHDRSGVLRRVLDRGASDDAIVARALDAAADIGSDHDRSEVLLSVVARGAPDAAARAAFFRAVDGMGSDSDRRRVLSALAARDDVAAESLRALLASAARLGSDHDKSSVLLAVAARPERLRDASVRAAFDAALKTVGSDSDYRRVMSAVAR